MQRVCTFWLQFACVISLFFSHWDEAVSPCTLHNVIWPSTSPHEMRALSCWFDANLTHTFSPDNIQTRELSILGWGSISWWSIKSSISRSPGKLVTWNNTHFNIMDNKVQWLWMKLLKLKSEIWLIPCWVLFLDANSTSVYPAPFLFLNFFFPDMRTDSRLGHINQWNKDL